MSSSARPGATAAITERCTLRSIALLGSALQQILPIDPTHMDSTCTSCNSISLCIQEVVGRQLERGLGPLRQLPGAVAAEVVEEMRATALQRGLQNGGMAADSSSAGGGFQSQGALMLGDGAEQAWQARFEMFALAIVLNNCVSSTPHCRCRSLFLHAG